MKSYVEHANITVNDIDETILFLTTALPDFIVRHDSGPGPKRWVHLGTESTYISINQLEAPAGKFFEQRPPGYNHLGFAVADADALRKRMLNAGYREGFVPDPHPNRKRVYFIDNDNMQYEFVQYYSDDTAKRNSYE
jgi:catechol 2,3-dioxygenase-like lactoylglutathione lyase family enzyme